MHIAVRFRVVARRCAGILLAAVAARASAVPLVVKGSVRIDTHVARDGSAFVIRGTVRDDAGELLPHHRFSISLVDSANGAQPVLHASVCGQPHANTTSVFESDSSGTFCVVARGLPERGELQFSSPATATLAPLAERLPYDANDAGLVLRWTHVPEAIDLDAPTFHAVVSVQRVLGREAIPHVGALVRLSDETRATLATATSDERGLAVFDVPTQLLQSVGRGELVAECLGRSVKASVMRVAHVGLVASPPAEPVVMESGVDLIVRADTSRGPARAGVMEARVGSERLASARVENGLATLHLTYHVPAPTTLPLDVSFLPTTPEYQPKHKLTIPFPVKPPSPWRSIPWLAAGLGVVALLVRGWRRLPRRERTHNNEEPAQLPALSWEAVPGRPGFVGLVLDAHEATPIPNALVRVVARGFGEQHVVAQTHTASNGTFELDVDAGPNATLVVEAPLHATLMLPAPRAGKLTLALVSRRRAVLASLVRYYRKQRPSRVDPTPHQIASEAAEAGKHNIVAWARAVEEVAFDAPVVDVVREATAKRHEVQ